VPSVAFAHSKQARLSLVSLRRFVTTPQASLHAADRPVARPLKEALSLRFDDEIPHAAGSRATGDPGVSPDRTFTGWLS